MAGKLGVRGLVNAVAPGQLMHVTDQLTNRRFLVDTGAAFSILPHHSSVQPSGPHLIGPNGVPIACWGDKPVQLVLDGRRYQWTFLLAAVQFPIIGIDFIRAHHLLVDPSSDRLVDKLTYQFVKTDSDKLQAVLPGISSLHHPTIYSPPTVQWTTAPPPVQRTSAPPPVQQSPAPTSLA